MSARFESFLLLISFETLGHQQHNTQHSYHPHCTCAHPAPATRREKTRPYTPVICYPELPRQTKEGRRKDQQQQQLKLSSISEEWIKSSN